jgi:hypothetical protein
VPSIIGHNAAKTVEERRESTAGTSIAEDATEAAGRLLLGGRPTQSGADLL